MNSKSTFLPDLLITIPAVLLLSLSILVIYSTDPKLAFQQALFALVGFGIYWFISLIDIENLEQYFKYLYFFVLLLLLVVFVLGVETRGSARWIPLGIFQLQPSEFAKPVLILLLAQFWSKNLPTWINIGKSLLIISPALIFVFKQPDLGTTLTLGSIWFFTLIAANISWLKLVAMGVISAVAMPSGWHFLKEYQKMRIISFLDPEKDPLGRGYNVIQAMIAVGSGQFLGRGLGRGTQSRLRFLPEHKTDFMFASIAEEFGLIGSALVLVLYGVMLVRGFIIATLARTRMESVVVLGVIGMLFFQIVVNIGMNIGVMPVTGITLPLLSYGGSSIISVMICLGLVTAVARSGRQRVSSLD